MLESLETHKHTKALRDDITRSTGHWIEDRAAKTEFPRVVCRSWCAPNCEFDTMRQRSSFVLSLPWRLRVRVLLPFVHTQETQAHAILLSAIHSTYLHRYYTDVRHTYMGDKLFGINHSLTSYSLLLPHLAPRSLFFWLYSSCVVVVHFFFLSRVSRHFENFKICERVAVSLHSVAILSLSLINNNLIYLFACSSTPTRLHKIEQLATKTKSKREKIRENLKVFFLHRNWSHAVSGVSCVFELE